MNKNTKQYLSLALITAVFATVGCNKQDDAPPAPAPVHASCSNKADCTALTDAQILDAAINTHVGSCQVQLRSNGVSYSLYIVDGGYFQLVDQVSPKFFLPVDVNVNDSTTLIGKDQIVSQVRAAIASGDCFFPAASDTTTPYTFTQLYMFANERDNKGLSLLGTCSIEYRPTDSRVSVEVNLQYAKLVNGTLTYIKADLNSTDQSYIDSVANSSYVLVAAYNGGKCFPNQATGSALNRNKINVAPPAGLNIEQTLKNIKYN